MVSPASAHADTLIMEKSYEQPASVKSSILSLTRRLIPPHFRKKEKPSPRKKSFNNSCDIVRKSPYATQKQIGTSIEGRSIPALYFTKGSSYFSTFKKPTIWLQAQIHGNEPASGESALVIAKRLAGEQGERILNHVNIIIVPRINLTVLMRLTAGLQTEWMGTVIICH
ncbi:M14 family zinc carboxypeptidase [Bacillus sp. SL00103]